MARAERRQQQVEELAAAALRALSGEAELYFRGGRLHRQGRPLPLLAPHLQPEHGQDDFGSFRGAADGVALRLALSDGPLHQRLRPSEAVERVLFDLLEQFRVESLAPAALPGVVANLRHRHEQWCVAAQRDGLTDSAAGLLLYTVAQVARARVTAQPVVEATEGLIEATRMAIGPSIGQALSALRRTRHDQAAYAPHALAIARRVGASLRGAVEDKSESDAPDADAAAQALSRLLDFDSVDGGDPVLTAGHGTRDAGPQGGADAYRAYTTAYDTERRAATLVRPEQLREFRALLDERIAEHGINVARLARELKALLAVPQRDGWDGARDEGRIDGRRLAQLVASPTERRLFRTERELPVADCTVAFLIDCSGSMRQHVEGVALMVDVLARALEQAGAETEVLGFTTGAWNGGRARKDWLRAGRPPQPGRLNELSHLVFKDADTPWRRARRDLAALLKADLFREGIDGEAVDWACRRLAAREVQRRVLVVVSDGCPMDAATAQANGEHYLDEHLKAVVARHEREGREGGVQMVALGVGLDLSPYYRRSLALDAAAAPSHAALRDVAQLVGGR
jgi:cobaltochelatase CobT